MGAGALGRAGAGVRAALLAAWRATVVAFDRAGFPFFFMVEVDRGAIGEESGVGTVTWRLGRVSMRRFTGAVATFAVVEVLALAAAALLRMASM